MKITVTSLESSQIAEIDIDPAESIENLKAIVEVEINILIDQQELSFNGNVIKNSDIIQNIGIKEGDLLIVKKVAQMGNPQTQLPGLNPQSLAQSLQGALSAAQPQATNNNIQLEAKAFKDEVMANPDLLQQLIVNNPTLAEAVLSENPKFLEDLLIAKQMEKRKAEQQKIEEIQALNDDPFNTENQAKIEEQIRMGNVNENMENAMEFNPESFGRVIMLYINCEVNGKPVKAFVDSGAQSTIMSIDCAEKCGIMRLVDKRFGGVAQGVGTAKILGKVHLAPIKIENSFFNCSFTILESQGVDFLLGLDMLKSHQCVIDLGNNCLKVGSLDNSQVETRFLSEAELPKNQLFSPNETEKATDDSLSIQPQSPQSPQTLQPPQQNSDLEAKIKILQDNLGVSRERAIEALSRTGGNIDLAASSLAFI